MISMLLMEIVVILVKMNVILIVGCDRGVVCEDIVIIFLFIWDFLFWLVCEFVWLNC